MPRTVPRIFALVAVALVCREVVVGQAAEMPPNAQPPKHAWPDLVGLSVEAAAAAIRAERANVQPEAVPEDAMVTMDHREDRVRLWVDASGVVSRIPKVG